MSIRFDAADAHWRVAPLAGFSAAQKDWLTRGGSLTAHLRALGAVTVRVTRECVALPWADESAALGIAPRAPVWVREVVLSVDGVPFVAAHSVTPHAASVGVWQATRRLRTRPLAELLYSDSSVARSALVSRKVTARHPLYRLAACEIGERAATCAACTSLGFRAARRTVDGDRMHVAGAVGASGGIARWGALRRTCRCAGACRVSAHARARPVA